MKLAVVLLLSVVAGEACFVLRGMLLQRPANPDCSWNDQRMHAWPSPHTQHIWKCRIAAFIAQLLQPAVNGSRSRWSWGILLCKRTLSKHLLFIAAGAIAEVNLRQLKTLDPTDVAAASAVGEAVINKVCPTAAH
jgi:hypothetical protein